MFSLFFLFPRYPLICPFLSVSTPTSPTSAREAPVMTELHPQTLSHHLNRYISGLDLYVNEENSQHEMSILSLLRRMWKSNSLSLLPELSWCNQYKTGSSGKWLHGSSCITTLTPLTFYTSVKPISPVFKIQRDSLLSSNLTSTHVQICTEYDCV